VQENVLDKITSDKLKAFVVWTPRYFGDNRAKALASMKLVNDKRAVHFWDGKGWLGKYYGKELKLPGSRTFAWDVYFVFDARATWEKQAPVPIEWMHQLGGMDGRQLDGNKLREFIRSELTHAREE
jgi:hypothetical protein